MIKKTIEILFGVPTQFRRYCEDFKDRKGCGQEVKIRTNAAGKKIACEPEKIPCLDDEGKTHWVWVPHWVTCSEQKEYAYGFMQKKSEEREQYKKDHPRTDASFAKENAPSFRRA